MKSNLSSPSEARKLGRVALVLHDAGAGLHGLGWLPQLGNDAILVAQGPSRGLAMRHGFSPTNDVAAAIDEADWVLTGTGWMSSYECDAIAMARRHRKPVLAILDHWVNYHERFGDQSGHVLPDGFVVSDEFAESIAKQTFPGALIVRWPNEHLRRIRRAVHQGEAALPPDHDRHLLLLGEPLRRNILSCKAEPEAHVLNWASEAVIDDEGHQIMPVRLRLHPSESTGKYDELILETRAAIKVVEGRRTLLSRDLVGAAAVVGFKSYSLFLASKCGLSTYSLASNVSIASPIPPGVVEKAPSPLAFQALHA